LETNTSDSSTLPKLGGDRDDEMGMNDLVHVVV